MKNLKTTRFLAFALLGFMICALRFVMADDCCSYQLSCGGGAAVQIEVTAGCGSGSTSTGMWRDSGAGCGNHSYQSDGIPVMRSKNDIAYATASAACPIGGCVGDIWVWSGCGQTTFSISPGTTGCKIDLVTDQCGSRKWMISQPKHTGVVTVMASVTGQCGSGGGGCSFGPITYTTVGKLQVDLGGGTGGGVAGCSTCGSVIRAGFGRFELVRRPGDGWVMIYRLYLGRASPFLDAGYISLGSPAGSSWLAEPAALEVPFTRPGVEVITASGGSDAIEQVKMPEGLVNVTVINDHQYQLEVFSTNNVTGKDGNGHYGTNGPAFVTWVVQNPGGTADTSHLNITEQRGGTQRVFQNTCTAASNRLDLLQPDGQTIESVWTVPDAGNSNITNYFHQVSSGAQVLKQTVQTYEFIPGLDYALLKQEVEGNGATARTSTYVYYSPNPTNGTSTNLLQRADYWDGKWAYYKYDSLGRVATNYSTYGNNAPPSPGTAPNPSLCTVTEYAYSLDSTVDGIDDDGALYPFTARRTIVKVPVAGSPQEISRTYHTVYASTWEETQQCPDPGAQWGAAANLRTVTCKDYQGRVVSSLNQDGTASVYTYQDDYTTIVQTGQPDNSVWPNSILSGTQTTTVVDELGLVQSVTSQDIATSVILSSQTYNYKDSGGNYLDPLRRSYDVTDLANRTTQYRYNDCCGLDYVVDGEGIKTYYEYDNVMKRQIGTRQVVSVVGSQERVIETTNRLDGLGRVLATMRVGTNGNVITQAQFQYDLLGQTIAQTNAFGGPTTYTSLIGSSGQTITTNVFPDGGTRVDIYNRDGQLAEVLGTAVQQEGYVNDTELDGSFYRRYTQAIKLDVGGDGTSEWTKTYRDGAGRAYKTAYAPRPGIDANPPCQLSFYSERNQLWKEVDADGVTQLFTYEAAQGGREYTVLALTGDARNISNYTSLLDALGSIKASSNRVSQVQRSVLGAGDGKPARTQVNTYVWEDGQTTGTLVSSSETSTNGLDSWQTVYRDANTPVVTHSQTAYGTTGGRSAMTIAPDGSYTISAYAYGILTSETRYDSLGTPLSTVTYGYDPHGRQNTLTDSRNGTSISTFNDADQVVTVTTPSPGIGQAPQTTTTFYNKMLQATNVVQPDGTSVTNEFLLSGQLKQASGSRTYPVGYSYDYAGRMTTMTNWSGFPNTGARVTTWNYNPYRGWLDNKRYANKDTGMPGSLGLDYTYTPAGRLEARTWATGITTFFSYNQAGDLENVDYDDEGTPRLAYTYDRLGRQAAVVQTGHQVNRSAMLAYNSANQLLIETNTTGSLSGLSVTNGYDQFLRHTALSFRNQQSTLETINYAYDNASRLQTVTDNTGATAYSAAYTYLANSPLVSQIAFKQGTTTRMTTTKQYDYLNRLASTSSAIGQSAIGNSYGLNNANQRIRNTMADGSYWLYEYDSLGQVRSGRKYWPDQTPVAGQQFEYAHDDIGNRTQTKAGGDQNGANLRSAGYFANSLNQYTNRDVPGAVDVMGLAFATNTVTVNNQATYRKGEYFRKEIQANNGSAPVWQSVTNAAAGQASITGHVFVQTNHEQFYYDANGNLTDDGRWSYTWDAENRLVYLVANTAVGPQNSIKFEYDWQGRRIHKQVWPNTGWSGTPTNDVLFVYDGWNLLTELNATNSAVIRSYVWASDLSGTMQGAGGVGGLLFICDVPSAIGYCAPAYDGNGNVAALVSLSGGTNCATYEYGPFGELLRATGPMAKANPFHFSTKYQDDETDLLYYGYRYYNASPGRWLTKDPIDESGGPNAYEFIANDSVNDVDILGLLAAEVAVRVDSAHGSVEPNGKYESYIKVDDPSRNTERPLSLTASKPGASVNLYLDESFFADIKAATALNQAPRSFASLLMSTDLNGAITAKCPCPFKKVRAIWNVSASVGGNRGATAHASFDNNEAVAYWKTPRASKSGTTDKPLDSSYRAMFRFVSGQKWWDTTKSISTASHVSVRVAFECIE